MRQIIAGKGYTVFPWKPQSNKDIIDMHEKGEMCVFHMLFQKNGVK
jgi:hypothetical protein